MSLFFFNNREYVDFQNSTSCCDFFFILFIFLPSFPNQAEVTSLLILDNFDQPCESFFCPDSGEFSCFCLITVSFFDHFNFQVQYVMAMIPYAERDHYKAMLCSFFSPVLQSNISLCVSLILNTLLSSG